MTHLDERYHDLFDDADDPALTHLVGGLDRVYATPAPTRVRASIARVLEDSQGQGQPSDPRRTHRARRRANRTTGRRRWAIPVVIVVAATALIAGGAFADSQFARREAAPSGGVSTTIDQVAAPFVGGGGPASLAALGRDLNIARRSCIYTIAIRQVYADVNRVVVASTLSGPRGQVFQSSVLPAQPIVTDARGVTLRQIDGEEMPVAGAARGQADVFDAAGSATTTTPLVLHLRFPPLQALESVGEPAPPASHPCAYAREPYQNIQGGDGSVHPVAVSGAFAFTLTAPVTSSVRALNVNRTATSRRGTAITLERVITTPSETRVYLRGPTATDVAGGPPIASVLNVGGKKINGTVAQDLGGGREAVSFGENLYHDHGAWLLTVLTDPVMPRDYRSYTGSVPFRITMR